MAYTDDRRRLSALIKLTTEEPLTQDPEQKGCGFHVSNDSFWFLITHGAIESRRNKPDASGGYVHKAEYIKDGTRYLFKTWTPGSFDDQFSSYC
jgi:hypothetical protein